MDNINYLIERSAVDPQWRPILVKALSSLEAPYLRSLIESQDWLPGIHNLLAAFRRDVNGVRYILIGESPYPRIQSANGIAFYDAAVTELWSDNGLSKAVNRATSMRNILKTALLAEGVVKADQQGRITQQSIANIDKRFLIQRMDGLFANLHRRGFLMLNATPVLHSQRKPAKEAVYWRDFLAQILSLLADSLPQPATLILWGKIAETIEAFPVSQRYQQLKCEHPYNVSFIHNPLMQSLFAELKLLQR